MQGEPGGKQGPPASVMGGEVHTALVHMPLQHSNDAAQSVPSAKQTPASGTSGNSQVPVSELQKKLQHSVSFMHGLPLPRHWFSQMPKTHWPLQQSLAKPQPPPCGTQAGFTHVPSCPHAREQHSAELVPGSEQAAPAARHGRSAHLPAGSQ